MGMKSRWMLLLLVLLAVLLGGCVTKPQPRENGTSGEVDGTGQAPELTIADLERQLEAVRAAQKLQSDSLEARLRELEAALAAQVSAGNSSDLSGFTYEAVGSGVTVTGWTGTAKVLTIPSAIDGKPVVAIADGAFRDCELERVTVPDGVTSIGWFAFSGCYRLTSVTLPASVSSIGYGAFERCASGLRMVCPSGSYAAQYAASYGIPTSAQ